MLIFSLINSHAHACNTRCYMSSQLSPFWPPSMPISSCSLLKPTTRRNLLSKVKVTLSLWNLNQRNPDPKWKYINHKSRHVWTIFFPFSFSNKLNSTKWEKYRHKLEKYKKIKSIKDFIFNFEWNTLSYIFEIRYYIKSVIYEYFVY